jgi:preprotein translocase subunit YajC
MNSIILPLLMAAPPAAEGASAHPMMTLAPFILIIGIFYFLIIRPQNKKRKETEKMLSALKKGDKIVTIGGLYGTIQSVKETTVILKVDDNVKLEFLRSAISSVILVSKEDERKQLEENMYNSGETDNE